MAFLTALELSEARALAQEHGLVVTSVEALDAGSVNSNFTLRAPDGARYFARIYEEQPLPGAAAEATLLRELAALGVPVAGPLMRAAGGIAQTHQGKPFAVFPWVSGGDLCHGLLRAEHCAKLGMALAQVHLATPHLSQVPRGRFDTPDIVARLDFIDRTAPEYATDVLRIRQSLAAHVAARDVNLPRGLTHGDLFRDNVLWQGDEISALLDFESACDGPFVYDLMVCLLSWCFTDRFQLPRVEALLRGYDSVRALSPAEWDAAGNEAGLACLRFATTRITDFSMRAPAGKPPKRAYQRFLARLDAITEGALARYGIRSLVNAPHVQLSDREEAST